MSALLVRPVDRGWVRNVSFLQESDEVMLVSRRVRVDHIVEFCCPETPTEMSQMFISLEGISLEHNRHLDILDYSIIDIGPLSQGYGAGASEERGDKC